MNFFLKFGEQESGVIVYPVAANFVRLMGVRLLAGRDFDASITADTVSSVIVNETMVRDVLGASTPEIVRLLTMGFLKLVVLSVLIASPITWLVMNRWLRDFAYRIDIGWIVFAGTAGVAVLIAFVTIEVQAARAARANPVGNLRSE